MNSVGQQVPARKGRNEARLALMRAAPLAWVVSIPSGLSSLLPLVPLLDATNELCGFDGHFANTNPQLRAVEEDKTGLVLLCGPQGYVSPSGFSNRSLAPTWMFAAAKFAVRFEPRPEPGALKSHLSELVSQMEASVDGDWSVDEMGARFEQLAARITPFRALITQSVDEFKLGQDEDEAVLGEMIDGLSVAGDTDLVQWIRNENADRTP